MGWASRRDEIGRQEARHDNAETVLIPPPMRHGGIQLCKRYTTDRRPYPRHEQTGVHGDWCTGPAIHGYP